MKPKAGSFKPIKLISLQTDCQENRSHKLPVTGLRGDITTYTTLTKGITRNYNEQIYVNKLIPSGKMDKSLERHNLLKLIT